MIIQVSIKEDDADEYVPHVFFSTTNSTTYAYLLFFKELTDYIFKLAEPDLERAANAVGKTYQNCYARNYGTALPFEVVNPHHHEIRPTDFVTTINHLGNQSNKHVSKDTK